MYKVTPHGIYASAHSQVYEKSFAMKAITAQLLAERSCGQVLKLLVKPEVPAPLSAMVLAQARYCLSFSAFSKHVFNCWYSPLALVRFFESITRRLFSWEKD